MPTRQICPGPGAVRRDVRRYHAGRLALSDRTLERRLFGAPTREEMSDEALQQLSRHKMHEDEPRYDVVRACMGLLPRPDMTLLDIGCGRGRVLLYAALLGARRATGIEVFAPRAALARAAAGRLAPGTVRIVEGDALKLPWPKAEALIAMNPFYPSAYRRFRDRLVEYGRERRPLIVSASTLRDRMAADKRFRQVAGATLDWIEIGAFEVRP